MQAAARAEIMARLYATLRDREGGSLLHSKQSPTLSTGIGELDRLLGSGGFRAGTIAEWFSSTPGAGAGSLAVKIAVSACCDFSCSQGSFDAETTSLPALLADADGRSKIAPRPESAVHQRPLILVDRSRKVHTPALVRLGVNLKKTIVLYPATQGEELWAIDQSLRCPGVCAVLAWVGDLDDRGYRRLQLSAESGRGLCLLLRPPSAFPRPSWAHYRLLVEPAGYVGLERRMKLHVHRRPAGFGESQLELCIDDETGDVHVAATLADPKARRRSTGA